ncbi:MULTISPECIES: phosphotransferase [unclassified Nocardioides]|uniref:phosphotransferase n=1 Tax=unclassified Nocardioides TaxID=2615069 RepID=UPI0030142FFC
MIVLDRLTLAPGLVLLVVDDGDGLPRPVPWLVDGDRRATSGEGAATALVALLGGGSRALGPFRVTTWHHETVAGERSFGVDQTNESVVVGEKAVVKWLRAAEPGPHPAPSVFDALQRHRFDGMPTPWGLLEWSAPGDAAPRLLATVDSLLSGAVDGWTWTVGDLRSAVLDESYDGVRETGRRLGDLVGRMHAALAEDGVSAATADDLAAWEAGADRDLEQALAATTGDTHDLLARRAVALRAETRAPAHALGTPLIRVHGDLHVGQVLRRGTGADATYVVTDFDGNPVVPTAERLLPQPPALDVAGLAQSIKHAALVLRRHEPHHDLATVTAAAEAAEDAFLTSYAVTVATAGHPRLVQPALVRAFRLRQVCREFSYAAAHLPRWFYVPEAALPALLPLPEEKP